MPTIDDVMVLTRNMRGGGRPCGQRNIIGEDWMERGGGGGEETQKDQSLHSNPITKK